MFCSCTTAWHANSTHGREHVYPSSLNFGNAAYHRASKYVETRWAYREVRASPPPLAFVESINALIGVVLKFNVKNLKSREINEINKKMDIS